MTIFRFIDFEYNSTANPKLNLVSYAERRLDTTAKLFSERTEWLYGCADKVSPPPNEGIYVAFNVVAEASAMYSWGVDPTEYKWIDLQAEYRMLTNHWDKFRYGKQLIDGKEVRTFNPALKREKPKGARFDRPQTSLAAACYKLLDLKLDTEHKDEIRNLIIRNNPEEIEESRDIILEYNLSDVAPMEDMLRKIINIQKKAKVFDLKQMLERGDSVAHTALITMRGYPVDRRKLWNFSHSVGDILKDVQEDVNRQFPNLEVFVWDKKNNRYSMKQKPIKDWIDSESGKSDVWPRTETGQYSLSFETAWSKLYGFRSPYPINNFPAQMYRYLRLKQSLNGFIPKGVSARDNSNFFSYVGCDGRVRPYLNPYGAQSSRFQPKATGYLPLKPSWMRVFIRPPKGQAICGIDYKSQEFLIAALLSDDMAMIESYESGDVYADFAARAGALDGVSKEGPEYKRIRNKFKSTVLGIQYLMGPDSLAQKLTADTGEPHEKKDAERLIGLFREVYSTFDKWRQRTINQYDRRGRLQLADGWTIFGDNDNFRSVANCPVQGTGAVVLRRAIKLCHKNGLKPILPLHDALYMEFPEADWAAVDKFAAVMVKAFIDSIDHEKSKAIKIDIYAISPNYTSGSEVVTPRGRNVALMNKYVEGRALDEYNRFRKYFERKVN